MRFKIHNGHGIVSIRQAGGTAWYFRYKQPLAVVWSKPSATVERYLSMLPYEKDYREEIRTRVNNTLVSGFNGNTWDLAENLYPMFQILPAGEFSMKYMEALEVPHDWDLVFGSGTQSIYYGGDEKLYATQALAELNNERVAYYEELIQKGERPMAILFRSSFEEQVSPAFVLDGHHKLEAYLKLKIKPAVVEITHFPQTQEEIDFNMDELIAVMEPWAIESIMSRIYEKEKYLSKYVSDPASKIHKFIAHGLKRDFYANGQVKSEVIYKYDVPDGEANYWYENGQLALVSFVREGKHYGDTTAWYDNGQVRYVDPYNSKGELNGCQVSYYPDGKVQMMAWYDHGKSTDGNSYSEWYPNGQKKLDIFFLDGLEIEVREYEIQEEN